MPDREAVERMHEQVDAAYASAERLVREAEAAARANAADVPPRGWAGAAPEPEPSSTVEALKAIAGLLELARGAIPPELAHQFAAATRELLVAVRALIDWYLERLDQVERDRRQAPPEVEDIPID